MSDAPFSPNHADPSRDPHTGQDGLDPESGSAASADDAQGQGWADWQTVQFPDALNLEALEQEEEVAKPTARPHPKSAKAKPTRKRPDQPQVKAEPPAIAPEDDTEDDVIEPDWRPHVKSRQTIEVFAQAIDEQQAAEAPVQESVVDDQIEELLTLIRELNECNDALLSRVRHLEDTLTQCQSELDREVVRSQQAIQQQQEQELALVAAQQKAAQSADELEFVQQTVQRQQIQIETLEAQLETSQQRVAELERECALVQQKQQEQYHQLQESKQVCQDLRSRLQRQQRYTLQYKVALKKCLDVPPPRYQSAGEPFTTADTPTGFMPKVSEIQPWSSTQPSEADSVQPSPEHPSDLLAWMQSNPTLSHLFRDDDIRDDDATSNFSANWENELLAQTIDLTATQADDLFDQPITPDPVVEAGITSAAETDAINPEAAADRPKSQSPSSISYDVKHLARKYSHSSSSDMDDNAVVQAPESPSDTAVADAQLDAQSDVQFDPQINAVPRPPIEAEDALWEDLARLIDASTEEEIAIADEIVFEDGEFVDASLNSDEDESALFELDVEPNSPPPTQAEAAAQSLDSPAPPDFPTASSSDPEQPGYEPDPSARQEQDQANILDEQHYTPSDRKDSTWSGPFAPQANWPSPVVYPLRNQKPRRKSLASVELPSFPRAVH